MVASKDDLRVGMKGNCLVAWMVGLKADMSAWWLAGMSVKWKAGTLVVPKAGVKAVLLAYLLAGWKDS